MKRAAIVVAAALSLSASAPQEKAAIIWAKTWTDALAEAAVWNVPIYFTGHKDGWGECTVVERTAYPNPAVVAASKNLVCIVAHAGTGAKNSWDTNHGSKEIKKGTEKVKVCKIYSSIVCSDHVEIFKERVGAIYGNKTFPTPFHIYYSPTGEELSRVEGAVTPQKLAADMADALGKVSGNHVSKDDYDGVKAQIADAAALVRKDDIKKAIEAYTKITKHKNEMLRPMGTKELDALEASGHARVQAAIQTLESQGGEEKAKKELKKVADEYPPLPCSKEAAEILRLMAEKGR